MIERPDGRLCGIAGMEVKARDDLSFTMMRLYVWWHDSMG